MSSKTPQVWDVYVEDPEEPTKAVWLDRPEWLEWLELEKTWRFRYPVFDASVGYIVGFMTVRKERRERGGWYWIAYKRCGGKLRRVYLGASRGVTREKLEEVAKEFLAASRSEKGKEQNGAFQ